MTRYWTFDGIAFVHGRYSRDFCRHTHDDYSIGVVVSGAMSVLSSGGVSVAERSMISLVNPGQVHAGASCGATGWEYRNIFIPPSIMARYCGEAAQRGEFSQSLVDDREAARALIQVHEATETNTASVLQVDSLLNGAIGRLVEKYQLNVGVGASQRRAPIKRAVEYIREHFAEPIRVARLADLVGLSQLHFIRVFARETGLTPHAFQNQVRLARGVDLLRQGVSPADVAATTGYVDQSHFTHALRRSYGFTPGAVARTYRRNVARGAY